MGHNGSNGMGPEIHHDGDIPARSGMGSSSAFTVGLLKTLYALNGKIISKEDLFKRAIHIEQEVIKEHVASQLPGVSTASSRNHGAFRGN